MSHRVLYIYANSSFHLKFTVFQLTKSNIKVEVGPEYQWTNIERVVLSSIISALLLSHAVAVCADTTMTVSTGSSRISAPAEIGRTWRIIPIQTTAHPIATTRSGKQSSEPQPAGPALPETSAHPTTLAHPWDTAHLSITRQTIKAHQSRSGPAARHNRSYPGLLLATIDSATQQMPYRDCGLYPKAVQKHCVSVSSWLSSPHFSCSWSLEPGRWAPGSGSNPSADNKNQRIFLYLRV